jgi:hypothetical protein
MERRAQGISLNVIIIAAIGLVVLVILVALVFRSGGDIQQATNRCLALEGAQCVMLNEACPSGYVAHPTRTCPDEFEPKCCVPIG